MNTFHFSGDWRADVNLVIQLCLGAGLIAGMLLARAKKFSAHRICQTSIVFLNIALIGLVMVPSFHRQVCPNIHDPNYAVALVHATLGTLAELLALYVIAVAGTNLMPNRFKFQNYKLWMRGTLGLWLVALAFGVATYFKFYDPTHASAAQAANPAPTANVIHFKNFQFEPRNLTVAAGTTVEWVNDGGLHTVEADDGSFNSGSIKKGDSFKHRFEKPGSYPYFCGNHGFKGGRDMAGTVTVK